MQAAFVELRWEKRPASRITLTGAFAIRKDAKTSVLRVLRKRVQGVLSQTEASLSSLATVSSDGNVVLGEVFVFLFFGCMAMYQFRCQVTFVLFVLLSVLTAVSASDFPAAFVPGDAFFPVEISEAENASLGDDECLEYYLSPLSLPDPLRPNGHQYGFLDISIRGLQERERLALYTLCRFVREESKALGDDGVSNRIETPWTSVQHSPFPILIVNRDFPLGNRKLMLRYNEHWSAPIGEYIKHELEAKSELGSLGFGQYCPFFLRSELIIEDWRNSGNVEALKCSLPDAIKLKQFTSETHESRWRIEGAITADTKDVMFVGCPGSYDPQGGNTPDSLNCSIYVALDGEIRRYRPVFVAGTGKMLVYEAKMDFSDTDLSLNQRNWSLPTSK